MIYAPTAYQLACSVVVTLALLASCEHTQDPEPASCDASGATRTQGGPQGAVKKSRSLFPHTPGNGLFSMPRYENRGSDYA